MSNVMGTDTDGVLSRSSSITTVNENKENETPNRNPKQWYEGVVGKPVAFKAASRRSSQN